MVLARTPKTKEVATRAMKQAQNNFMSGWVELGVADFMESGEKAARLHGKRPQTAITFCKVSGILALAAVRQTSRVNG
jgi:hypothetical protein